MPEGVEVCATALFLDKKLKNKTLEKITILGGRYSKHTLNGLDEFNLKKPCIVTSVNSKGKFLWFELLDQKQQQLYILNHFGLGGHWSFTKDKFSHVAFEIKNTKKNTIQELFFEDMRNFGTIHVTSDINLLNKEINKLAPDFLKTNFDFNQFKVWFDNYLKVSNKRKNFNIVKVLMDQQAIGSGIGNYLSAEILYDAKISPYTKINTIFTDENSLKTLCHSIKYIFKLAFLRADVGYFEYLDVKMAKYIKNLRNTIQNDPKSKYNYHPEIHLSKNDVFYFKVYRQKKDPHGNLIAADKIIPGRTTYWCPAVQK